VSQYFKRHRDGIYLDPETGKQSQYTFLVYLNDMNHCTGGETQFYLPEQKLHIIHPQQGLAVIFFHNLIHEGLPIKEGYKYVLRSDLMYSSTNQELAK
jgi:prolyl 4-hydroxylase